MFNRIILIVLDSVGVGALPDASAYGDENADTLGNLARSQGGLFLPALERLGLGCIVPLDGVTCPGNPLASFGKMAEVSRGKDTTTGHWEIAGCPVQKPFPLYPGGFPTEVTDAFTRVTGLSFLGNCAASGTEIVERLGERHLLTGWPIIYTSADSVFQIAAHIEAFPLPLLYETGRLTREKVCVGAHAVGRVIIRPFAGQPGSFYRVAGRHDFSLQPPSETVLDRLAAVNVPTIGVGKIADLFAGQGIKRSIPTASNEEGMRVLSGLLEDATNRGLIFANLVDFDSVFGHRNDAAGYAGALSDFDIWLDRSLPLFGPRDLLLITADHGCDPTLPGTDHTREYVPLLAYAPGRPGVGLGTRATFADVGQTVADNFGAGPLGHGTSFLSLLTGGRTHEHH